VNRLRTTKIFRMLPETNDNEWHDVDIRQSESEKLCSSEKGDYQQWQSRIKEIFSIFSANQLNDD